ncbi:hypothetical protein A9Q89_01070 [Gammaproteobacteria bacterium 53_120_T64]|nr:hypothetical protein A9Q89_01070 [Gammaproteobacteria bacterium 53_120_T64]
MPTLFFTSRCGQGLQLCDATRPPRGGSWRREHFTRGQASMFVQSLPAHELRSLKFQLGSRYRIGALNPAAGLTQLLDSHRLSLYRKRPKPLKRQAETPAVPSASELRLAIAASLKLIVSRERAEALSLAKNHQVKSSTGKAAAHASALGQGLLASGTDLLHWLGNINDVVNPLWQLKRQVDAALITYEECSAASNGCLNLATRARYLKRVELADHQALVEALGFDPTTIDLDAFSQAWHSAWVLAGDKQVVALIGGFAKDYIDAQHALEYSRAAGNAVFEVLLALLLAAATAGAGLAMGMASKARHAGEFGRVGRKLVLLAEALEGSPRGIVRRRGMTTRVVDGGGSGGRRGGASKELENPELQASTDKVAMLAAKSIPNNPSGDLTENPVIKKNGKQSTANNFSYDVKEIPYDLIHEEKGAYGYVPKESSEFAPPWPVDWTDIKQVASARTVRLDYHQGLADEKKWIGDMRSKGLSEESVARQLVDIRNQTRMSKYSDDKLPRLYERNMKKYNNPNGPAYDDLLVKYGSTQEVINAGTRSNPTMDILTGIAKVEDDGK